MMMTMRPLFEQRQAEARRASAEDAERARVANHTVEMLLTSSSSVVAKGDEIHDRIQAERYVH